MCETQRKKQTNKSIQSMTGVDMIAPVLGGLQPEERDWDPPCPVMSCTNAKHSLTLAAQNPQRKTQGKNQGKNQRQTHAMHFGATGVQHHASDSEARSRRSYVFLSDSESAAETEPLRPAASNSNLAILARHCNWRPGRRDHHAW
jgi:hypothetical protein